MSTATNSEKCSEKPEHSVRDECSHEKPPNYSKSIDNRKTDGLDSGVMLTRHILSTSRRIERRKPTARVRLVSHLVPLISSMIHNFSISEARPLPGQERYEMLWPMNTFGDVYMVPPYWSAIVPRWNLSDFFIFMANEVASHIIILKKVTCDSSSDGYKMPWKEYSRMLSIISDKMRWLKEWATVSFSYIAHWRAWIENQKVEKMVSILKIFKDRLMRSFDFDWTAFGLELVSCKNFISSTLDARRHAVDCLERESTLVDNTVRDILHIGREQLHPGSILYASLGSNEMVNSTRKYCCGHHREGTNESLWDLRLRCRTAYLYEFDYRGQRIRRIETRLDNLETEIATHLAAGHNHIDPSIWWPCLESIKKTRSSLEYEVPSWERQCREREKWIETLCTKRECIPIAFRTILREHGGSEWLNHLNSVEDSDGFDENPVWHRDGYWSRHRLDDL